MIDKFIEIETKYNVEDIEYRGEKVWTFLRANYYRELEKCITKDYAQFKKNNILVKSLILLRESFYGFRNWFRSYDYIFFSDTDGRSKINNKFFDINFEKIIEKIGYDKSLYIELPNPKHYPIKDIFTKYIVSIIGLKFIIYICSKIHFYTFFNKSNISILDDINQNENINLNYLRYINSMIISISIYKFLFRIYKPKVIFLDCYYGKESIIKSAKDLGIKVVEVQHGAIGKSHFAYNVNSYLDNSYIPDILLTFGKYDKKLIESNIYNPFKEIKSIGRYSLEKLKDEPIPTKLLKIKDNYNTLISISTQYPVEKELAKFIKIVSKDNNKVGFLLSLRHYDKSFYDNFKMPNNVYLFKGEYSCYNILKVSDIHLSCYSTCALEATFFEKKVILLDINGLASQYMYEYQSNNLHIISNQDEFQQILSKDYEKEKLNIYDTNYEQNIEDVLKYLNINL